MNYFDIQSLFLVEFKYGPASFSFIFVQKDGCVRDWNLRPWEGSKQVLLARLAPNSLAKIPKGQPNFLY